MTIGVNYATNPRPTTTTGWTGVGCALAVSTAAGVQPGTGGSVLAATLSGAANPTVTAAVAGLTVGQRYCASMYVRLSSAAGALSVKAINTAVTGTSTRTKLLDRQVRIRVTFTATATTMSVGALVEGTPVANSVLYIGRLMVTDGELPPPYFDGDYPFASWAGTAHASTSSSTLVTQLLEAHGNLVVCNGLALQSKCQNVVTRTGRVGVPPKRGSNPVFPGESGAQFQAFRPTESGVFTLGMWILGVLSDGTIPPLGTPAETAFQENLAAVLESVSDSSAPITLYAWQPDGTVRTASADLSGSTDITQMMQGARGELVLVFEILESAWKDALPVTTVGTAGTGWSNQDLQLPLLAGGASPIYDAVVTVVGPIQNPVVTSALGVTVQYNGTLAGTDTWVVDSAASTSKVNGVSVLTNTAHAGHPRFVVIPPGQRNGAPKIHLDGTGTSAATNISVAAARRHWGA